MAKLEVDLAAGESLLIAPGGEARVELVHKSGRRVRLRISADREVAIHRDTGEPASASVSSKIGTGFVPRLAK